MTGVRSCCYFGVEIIFLFCCNISRFLCCALFHKQLRFAAHLRVVFWGLLVRFSGCAFASCSL
ncbi:hypothetical protein MtrunA17_Chr7g0236541 [Medicago truncatula]|uniref:Transmembrane protein n=1 Tax=Medicago truncatula TaxID=3880 RepID=A0A396GZJ1_MEDTR|nr:hypothetical protein MtrunA17_Chr7g0236541 [Medicago truncatula]